MKHAAVCMIDKIVVFGLAIYYISDYEKHNGTNVQVGE